MRNCDRGARVLSRRPGQRTPTEKMKVQMKHRLSGSRSDIKRRAVSILDFALARNLGGYQMTFTDDLRILGFRLFQPFNVLLRNDEHMGRSLRIDVLEDERFCVFINFLGRDLATDNAAEKTVHRILPADGFNWR